MQNECYDVKLHAYGVWKFVEGEVIAGTSLAVRKDATKWILECFDSGEVIARYKTRKAARLAREELLRPYEAFCKAEKDFRDAVKETSAIEVEF